VGQRMAVEVRSLAQLDRGHSGAPTGAWNLYTEDGAVLDGIVGRERGLHLGGGDVLPLPAEGVAEPVHEGRMAHALRAHHVARVEPAVALFESVAYQLLFAGLLVGVPVEGLQPVDRAEQQAGLSGGHPAHPAILVLP